MEKSVEEIKAYANEVKLFEKNRTKLVTQLKAAGAEENSVVILKGASVQAHYDTDTEYIFRQESYFFYVFGVEESDVTGLLEVSTGKVHLFVPKMSENLAFYLVIPTPTLLQSTYGYEAHFFEDFESVLTGLNPSKVYVNQGTNTDSGVSNLVSYFTHPALAAFSVDEALLFPVLTECRVFKLPEEIEILRRVAHAASEAHVEIMHHCKPNLMEYSLAATFAQHVGFKYGQTLSFTPISASGNNGSVLHYPFNNKRMNAGELVVCDMGSVGYGYCSDITCTIPVSGSYNEKQRAIYETVLKANTSVFAACKPGVNWLDMHKLAEKVVLEGLVALGILQGDIEEMLEKRIGAIFMPHGLGHFLGMDVHDVGGYNKGEPRADLPGLRNLRTRRDLEPGMVITIEPGCYFIDFALDSALNDPEKAGYFNNEVLAQFRGFGGVRLEDDVLITESGAELLNKVPRTVEEVERTMSGAGWSL